MMGDAVTKPEDVQIAMAHQSSHSLANKLLRVLWQVVYVLLFRPSPRIFHGWRRFLLRCFGAKVGRTVYLYPDVRVWAPWNLDLREYCALGHGVECYCVGKITIGRNATISQETVLCTASHDYSDMAFPLVTGDIHIGDHAWVASQVFVMPDVKIGEGTVVGVRSLVLHSLPPWSIAVGSPCKVIGPREMRCPT